MAASDDRTHGLDIGIKDPSGLIVGVTDVIAGRRFLMTELTLKCHGATPSG